MYLYYKRTHELSLENKLLVDHGNHESFNVGVSN